MKQLSFNQESIYSQLISNHKRKNKDILDTSLNWKIIASCETFLRKALEKITLQQEGVSQESGRHGNSERGHPEREVTG